MDIKELPGKLLQQSWDSCLDQEEWFPPLEQALQGVTAKQAVWKPLDGPSNCIHETENNTGTFNVEDASEAGWAASKEELYRLHRELSALFEKSDIDMLGRKFSDGGTLGGGIRTLAMQEAYHIGQIVMLSKMQGVWPATRSFS
ncbi:hypothetical protein [Saccharibacillus sacchari]|uniref:hypothetical protein n=1 Tax=Saccharibacillus sacchari TaxID=456493 RepID=UPI0004B065E2|nr:hypothetical protein [Saccharibacillus sacchari]